MSRIITTLAAVLIVAGCASAKLSPEVATELNESKVAAAFYMEGKKINYDELVYKVLWNENRSQESVFEGAWDIDRDVTKTFADSLERTGLQANAAHQVLGDARYADLERAILNTRGADGMNVPMSMSSSLRDAFLASGVDYLILLRAAHYQVQKVSGFKPQFSIPALLVVYDIRNGQQQYKEIFPLGGAIPVEKSPREVEANNLAKLKASTHEWMEIATTSRLPKALGLTDS